MRNRVLRLVRFHKYVSFFESQVKNRDASFDLYPSCTARLSSLCKRAIFAYRSCCSKRCLDGDENLDNYEYTVLLDTCNRAATLLAE